MRNNSHHKYIISLFIVSLVIFNAPLSWGQDSELKNVKLIPLWKPQAQFAGYYMAQEKGIYKKYGLNVTILEGGSDSPPGEFLKEGKADFAVMWLSSAIKKRSEGLKIVNVAQIIQRSALMLVVKKSSGIEKPQDLNGKKVNLWEGELRVQPEAFFRKHNINAKIIPQSYTVNLFLNDGVDAVSAMWYNEYHTIINSGINPDELFTFLFSDYGLNFPEDGIYMLEEAFNKDPQLAKAFVQASLEGWQYASLNQEETVDVVLKYMNKAHIPANRAHQKWMLSKITELMIPKDNSLTTGELNQTDYQFVTEEFINSGLIKAAPEFNAFYKPADKK